MGSDITSLIFAGAFGLVFGSFATALSYRLPRGESVAQGRSRCPTCGHTLAAFDLVPVLSWLANKGGCRYCRATVPWRYPAIEVVMAALFVAAAGLAHDLSHLCALLAMSFLMVVMAVIDFEHRRVPNLLLAVLVLLALFWHWLADGGVIWGLVTAAALVAAGVVLDSGYRAVAGKSGLGMGDTKLFAACGAAFPFAQALLFVALAGTLGVMLGIVWRWRTGERQFPFVPAILAAAWACLTFGDRMLHALVTLRFG